MAWAKQRAAGQRFGTWGNAVERVGMWVEIATTCVLFLGDVQRYNYG